MIEQKGELTYPFNLHDGKSPLTIQSHFLTSSQLPVMVQTWEFPVGGSEGVHRHPDNGENLEELYFVISGVARLLLNGESHMLHEGDAALTQPNDLRGVENAGDTPLRVMVIWGHPADSRPDFKEFETVQAAYKLHAQHSV